MKVYTGIDTGWRGPYLRPSDRLSAAMPLTRAFKSGNSQAVRIPAELAYEDTNVELSIDRYGDVIVISPVRGSMADAVAKLRALAKRRGQQVREPIEMPDRAWD